MRKVAMHLAGGAVAVAAALAAAPLAQAGPLTGTASLGLYPDPNSLQTTTVNPGPHITSLTSSVTEPSLLVRGADTGGDFVGVIPANTPAVFSSSSLPVPLGLGSAAINITLTVDGFVF